MSPLLSRILLLCLLLPFLCGLKASPNEQESRLVRAFVPATHLHLSNVDLIAGFTAFDKGDLIGAQAAYDRCTAAPLSAYDAHARRLLELELKTETPSNPNDWMQFTHWQRAMEPRFKELLTDLDKLPSLENDDLSLRAELLPLRALLQRRLDPELSSLNYRKLMDACSGIFDRLAKRPATPPWTPNLIALTTMLEQRAVLRTSEPRHLLISPGAYTGSELISGDYPEARLQRLYTQAAELFRKDAESHARFLLLAARHSHCLKISTPELQQRWAMAVTAAKGTPDEAAAEVEAGLSSIVCGTAIESAPASPVPLGQLLQKLGGLRTKASTIPDSHPFSQLLRNACEELEIELKTPHLVLSAPSLLLPGEKLEFAYGHTGLDDCEAILYPAPKFSSDHLNSSKTDNPAELRKWLTQNGHLPMPTPVWRQAIPSQTSRDEWSSGKMTVEPPRSPGVYYLVLQAGKGDEQLMRGFRVSYSTLGCMLMRDDTTHATAFLSIGREQAPLANQQVDVLFEPYSGKPEQMTGTTDKDGRLDILLPEGAAKSGGYLQCSWQGQTSQNYLSSAFLPPALTADLMTDRPLYAPGDTVRWRVLLRERRQSEWKVAHQSLKFRFTLAGEALADLGEVTPDDEGIIEGEFKVPASSRTGPVFMEINGNSTLRRDHMEKADFRIGHYVPPPAKATLSLGSDARYAGAGAQVILRAAVSWNSGGGIPGIPLELTLHVVDGKPTGQASESFAKWLKQFRNATLSATTGSDGNADFTLDLPKDLQGKLDIFAQLKASMPGAESMDNSLHFVASASGLHVRPAENHLENGWVALGAPFHTSVIVQDALGRPVSAPLTARWVELRTRHRWANRDGRLVEGHTHPEGKGWRRLANTDDRIEGEEHSLRPDAEGRVTIDFAPQWEGIHTLELRAWGQPIGVETSSNQPWKVCVINEHAPSVEPSTHAATVWPPLNPSAAQGVRIFINQPQQNAEAILLISGEHTTVKQRLRGLAPASLLELPEIPLNDGELGVSLYFQSYEDSMSPSRCSIHISKTRSPLTLKVECSAKEAQPGDRIAIDLELRKKDGTPTTGTVTLSAYDEGLNTLLPVAPDNDFPFDAARPAYPAHADAYSPTKHVYPRISADEVQVPADPRPGTLSHSSELDPLYENPDQLGYYGRTYLSNVFGLEANPGYLSIPSNRGISDRSTGAIPLGTLIDVRVRRNFQQTALWLPRLKLDASGHARTSLVLPDNLTTWQINAKAANAEMPASFGTSSTWLRTTVPLQARLLLPRQLTEGDSCTAIGSIYNATDRNVVSNISLQLNGASAAAPTTVSIPAQGQSLLDVPLNKPTRGTLALTLRASAESCGDGTEQSVPVHPDEAPLTQGRLLTLPSGSSSVQTTFPIPEGTIPDSTTLSISLENGPLAAVAAALPYLLDYPYSCTEQTTSRYAPVAALRRILLSRGMSANAFDDTFLLPAAARATKALARPGPASPCANIPNFEALRAYTAGRLRECESFGGGLAWWPQGRSDTWMTSYALLLTSLAQQDDAPDDYITQLPHQTGTWLVSRWREDATTSSSSALKAFELAARSWEADGYNKKLLQDLVSNLPLLDDTALCALSIAAARLGSPEQKSALLARLEARAQTRPDAGGLAFWGDDSVGSTPDQNSVECTSLALLGLTALSPRHPLAEPAARWLLLKREGPHWATTRQTALASMALLAQVSTAPVTSLPKQQPLTVEVRLANKPLLKEGAPVRLSIAPDAILPHSLEVPLALGVRESGNATLQLVRLTGSAPLTAALTLNQSVRMDAIRPTSNACTLAISVLRQTIVPQINGEVKRVITDASPANPVQINDQVLLKVRLSIPTTLKHLMLTVPRAAGLEPISPLGARDVRLERLSATEQPAKKSQDRTQLLWRDEYKDRSVIFLDEIEAGEWEITLPLRAYLAGDFRVPPATLESMYVPSIRANTAASRLKISH